MFTFIKRSLYVLSNKFRRSREPAEWMKEKWIADFSKPEKSCFTIKPEISYNAYLEKGALFLGLKKKNCMAWLETANRVYTDHIIEARFRSDSFGGYSAAGIMFRIAEQGTYYLALVSNKGYFRLDTVNNNVPRPLIGWIEASGLNGYEAKLGIIAKGGHLLFFLNGKWIAEAYDDSIPGGHLGFTLVSYDLNSPQSEMESSVIKEGYACQSWLDFLSVDSRPAAVEAECHKWCDSAEINAESRFRLAKNLAALDYCDAAHEQLLKAWKQREILAKSVMATYTEMRTKGELLFAAQMALRLEQYAAAVEYINTCFEMDLNDEERPSLYAMLGHAHWNLNDYKAAAAAWDKAFSLNGNNGLYAASAANAFELMGKPDKALRYRLSGARCFLEQKDYPELATLIPKLQEAFKLFPDNKELLAVAAAINQSRGKFPPEHFTPLKPARRRVGEQSAVKPPEKKELKRRTGAASKTGAAKKPETKKKIAAKPEQKPAAREKAKPVTVKKTVTKPKAAVSGTVKKTGTKTGKTAR